MHAIKVDNENKSILRTGRAGYPPPGFIHPAVHQVTARLGPRERKTQTANVTALQSLYAVTSHSEVFP